jgi:hypothetical protein
MILGMRIKNIPQSNDRNTMISENVILMAKLKDAE